jgi:probable rRNA maturation factor
MPERATHPRQIVPEIELSIAFYQRARGRQALLRTAARSALAQGSVPASAQLLIRITDDAELQMLNAQFRAKDTPTDVLSFATELFRDGVALGTLPVPLHLGEIYISMDLCSAQARAHGHAVDAELRLLVIHGVLHLLGFDHMQAARKRAMWAAQDRAFATLGLVNPLATAKTTSAKHRNY